MISWAALILLQTAASLIGGTWLDVPFIHQPKNGCGSASIWMVMQYWKTSATPAVENIHHELFSKEADGIYASDMAEYFRRYGFQTFVLNGTWDTLAENIAKGRPLIVCLERNARGIPFHYVVVAGLDRTQDLVWINDPAERKLLPVRQSEFEKQWAATDHWTLLAVPDAAAAPLTSRSSATATPDTPALAAASTAFRSRHFTEAEDALRSALHREGASPFVNDFLGTVYLLDNNLDAALKYWNHDGKPKLREIRIDPPLRMDPVQLDHAFAFSRAGVLTSDSYETTRQRLDSLGIFLRYHIELTPTEGNDFDLTFHASEQSGPEYLSWIRGLPYQTIYPGWWNIRGAAVNVQSTLRWQAGNRRGLVSLSGPLRENASLTYRIDIDVRNQDWQVGSGTFNLRRNEVSGDIHVVLGKGWAWTTGGSVTHRSYTNEFPTGNALTYRTSLRKTVLQIPEKRLTLDWSAKTEIGKVFGMPTGHFTKTQSNLAMRWFPFSRHGDDFETRAQIRLGESFGLVPFDELFILGLDRDSDLRLRAQNARQMGRSYGLMNLDLAKRLYANGLFRLDAGPFLDTARVASQPKVFADAGIQLRVSVLNSFSFTASIGQDLHSGHRAVFVDSVH